MIDKFEEHFMRIFLLLLKYGGKVLQHRIKYELYQEWQTVSDFLLSKKHDILHLTLGNKNCCVPNCQTKKSEGLSRSNFSVMYQNVEKSCTSLSKHNCSCYFTPKANVDRESGISSWDITLTSRLLLEFFIKEPSQQQVIRNLREHRNKLLHGGKPGMDEIEFSKKWREVSCAILEVAEKCETWFYYYIGKEIETLKSDSFTVKELDRINDIWRKVKEVDNNCHNGNNMTELPNLISELLTELHKDNTVSTEMKNIAWYAEFSLKDHCKKDYIEPEKAMKHSLKHLEVYRTIFVIGNAGAGKTRFCLELMTQFQSKHPDLTPLILTESSEWRKLEFNKKYIIFIDDIVGRSNLNVGAFESWSSLFDRMNSRLDVVYIIFALRNCIWQLKKDDFAEFTLFKVHNPIDLSGSEFALTSKEKLKMLKTFCKRHGVGIDYFVSEEMLPSSTDQGLCRCISLEMLNTIADMEVRKGFPYLCVMFFSSNQFLREGPRFFRCQSFYHEKKQVDHILEQEKYIHYALLVFFFLKARSFTREEILQSKTKISEIASMIGDVNPKKVIKVNIQRCFEDLQDTLLSVSDNILKLKHMVTYEAVLMSFGENFPEEFLKCINKTVLFAYVRTNSYVTEDHEVILRLSQEMTCLFAEKLMNVYGSKIEEAYTDVYRHPAFQDEELVVAFLDIVAMDDRFTTFINSFVAGACMNKKDILASETIKRFLSCEVYEFVAETFDIVVGNDLVCTCDLYINNDKFRNFLFEVRESTDSYVIRDFFLKAYRSGSLQCVKALLNIYSQENDLEVDGDLTSPKLGLSLKDHIALTLNYTLSQHEPSHGNDWSEVLVHLDEILCPSSRDKQFLYSEIIIKSISICKLEIALKYLEKIYPVACIPIRKTMLDIFLKENQDECFYALCSKMKKEKFQLRSKIAAEICISCVLMKKKEEMFLTLLNQNKCDFTVRGDCGNTILHACEQCNISNATLLQLLKRPEGLGMFVSQNEEGRTPVQYRETYIKARKLWTKGVIKVQNVKWWDDTFIFYSSENFLLKKPTFKSLAACLKEQRMLV